MQREKLNHIRRQYNYIAGVVIFLILTQLFYSGCQKDNNIEENIYGVEEIVKIFLPGYELMSEDNLDSAMEKYFTTNFPSIKPTVIYDDFDDNGLKDYAVLAQIIKKQEKKNIFAILSQVNKNDYKPTFIVNIGTNMDLNYIISIKAGNIINQAECIGKPMPSVKLKYSAIKLVYFEKSAVVYYWNDRECGFDSLWVSD